GNEDETMINEFDNRLIDEVFETDGKYEYLGCDLGDDGQADEVRGYERYITSPPDDLVIRNHENDDTGRLGIVRELDQEWTDGRRPEEQQAEDERPAEVAAMQIVEMCDD
ncbi:hypothetical protein ACW9HQ_38205, partial [Nocardia gipuzkoensis]